MDDFTHSKRTEIKRAVHDNDVEVLQRLLDSPEWYNFLDGKQETLLQMAILTNSKEAFDFLLTLPSLSLDMIDDQSETALMTAIRTNDTQNGHYYPWSLIKAGADIFCRNLDGVTTLMLAASRKNNKMVHHLVANGIDVNLQDQRGNTALHYAVTYDDDDCLEIVGFLLENGVDVELRNVFGLLAFEKAALKCSDTLLHEILFYYTFDEYSKMKTYPNVLLKLAKNRSPLITHFKYTYAGSSDSHLFDIDAEYLEILARNFKNVVFDALQNSYFDMWSSSRITIEKLDVLINSDLKFDVVFRLRDINTQVLFTDFIRNSKLNGNTFSNRVLYLLSYGSKVCLWGLHMIFEKFGYCELMKILLFMEIPSHNCNVMNIVLALLYDVKLDLDYCLANPDRFYVKGMSRLLYYYVNSRLNMLCKIGFGEVVKARIEKLPKVPSLVELARNACRKHLVQTFGIDTSRQFYTVVNTLNVPQVCKDIITFKKVLY